MTHADRVLDLDGHRTSGVTVLSGRERGERVRQSEGLAVEDAAPGAVEVRIPRDILSISSSFFLGLFGDSIRALGAEKFRAKYRFSGASAPIESLINNSIREALRRESPLARRA